MTVSISLQAQMNIYIFVLIDWEIHMQMHNDVYLYLVVNILLTT